MARFYADIQGNRGGATRSGDAYSGMESHTRGWDIGARVRCFVGPDGENRVVVSLTHGSTGAGWFPRELGTFRIRGRKIVKDNS